MPNSPTLMRNNTYDRRRSPSRGRPDPPVPPQPQGLTSSASSSSAYSRYHPTAASASAIRAPGATPPRAGGADTPPASTYFTHLPGASHQREPEATADAGAHFAYSTTLRRHHEETLFSPTALFSPTLLREEGTAGLWQRTVDAFAGHGQARQDERSGYAPLAKQEQRETPSARFAHYSIEDTVAHFHTSVTHGLSASTIPILLSRHGYNEFSVSSPESVLLKFAKTIYESPLILLLCGSAVVSAVMGNVDDAVSITVAVLIVLTVGFIQERRSEKSLEALNKLVPHHCHIIRDGVPVHLLANELVPGDVVTFSTGDRVPADLRIVVALDLEIDESSLTGETAARRKSAEPCRAEDTQSVPGEPVALADRTCIGYMGTLVRNGRGTGIVIATGTQTEFGVIFTMMQEVEEKRTPLQLSMDELAKKLSILSFGIIGVICVIGVLQQRHWLDMFTIGVSLAVAAIPEGLPIVTTVTLALGVLRMAKRKAIVKKLHSVEALGSVSVICSDKTGTLTKNEQTVTEIYAVDEIVPVDPSAPAVAAGRASPAARKVLEVGAMCNNAARNEEGAYVGHATDVALLNVLSSFDIFDPRESFTRHAERPFSSETKFMAVSGMHTSSTSSPGSPPAIVAGRETCYVKGAIESLLDRCKMYHVSEGSTPALDARTRQLVLDRANAAAARGLRVIATAYGFCSADALAASRAPSPSHAAPASALSNAAASVASLAAASVPTRPPTPSGAAEGGAANLVFVGFEAMRDPPRKGVADAVGLLQAGGVQVVMITGDAEQTALAIARDLGLRVGRVGGRHASGDGGAHGHMNGNGNGHGHGHGHERRGTEGGSGGAYCLTGAQVERMSKAQLREAVGTASVFARTTPRHKMAIVEAFQARGAVVAMTGDGVNDAPALKMADIGISMGKSGTDVAKEAADMILVDDNFTTILPAVEEGKSIFHNIQNFLAFQLSTAAAALTLITLSTLFGLSNPLNAMQILFINILMDGPPSQSLGVDPVDPAVMRKPPRRKNEPIISRRLLYRVLFSASIIVVGTLFVYSYALSDDHMSRREQTMTFTSFVFLDLVSAVQNRGLGCGLAQNRMLVSTVGVSFVTQLALVYVPMLQAVFQTQALSGGDLCTLLVLAGASMVLHEGRRRYERQMEKDGTWASAAEEMA